MIDGIGTSCPLFWLIRPVTNGMKAIAISINRLGHISRGENCDTPEKAE